MPPAEIAPASDRAADLALLIDQAREAGEIARLHHRTDVATWEKPEGAGPVTAADIAIDRMLKRTLLAARPDHGWLSEEIEDDPARLDHDRVFIVDPIDGTRAFMRGDDSFCHALAIAEAGEVTVAVAYFPIRDQMYWAVKGGGAFLDGTPLHVSARAEIDGAVALSGQKQMHPSSWPGAAAGQPGVPQFTGLSPLPRRVRPVRPRLHTAGGVGMGRCGRGADRRRSGGGGDDRYRRRLALQRRASADAGSGDRACAASRRHHDAASPRRLSGSGPAR